MALCARRSRGVLLACLLGMLCARVEAAVFTVRNFFDSGTNSLREVLTQASSQPGPHTINFDFSGQGFPAPPYMMNLETPLPAIHADVTINGPGADVLYVTRQVGAPNFGLLSVSGNVNVVVQNLLFLRGGGAEGGAISFDGNGSLTVRVCSFNQCVASGAGGAIRYHGTGTGSLTIEDSYFVECSAGENGGAVCFVRQGGAANLTIARTTFKQNAVTNASAGRQGGALFVRGAAPSVGIITASSFVGNSAPDTGFGGGVRFEGAGGSLSVTNSTFTGNSAMDGTVFDVVDSTTSLLNCTITSNTSMLPGGAGVYRSSTSGALTARNCIISGNAVGTAFLDLGASQTLVGNNNLIGVGSNAVNGVNGNIVGVTDPKLSPLNTIGGSTPTFALRPGSPAMDAGSNADAPGTDQRGQPRPADGDNNGSLIADIGAFETQKFVVTNSNDNGPGSLRQAIIDNNQAGGGFVRFAIAGAGLARTIAPTTALPIIYRPVFLDGWSQGGPSYVGPPLIEIDGNAIPAATGLILQTSDSILRGLAINRFKGSGAEGIGLSISTNVGIRNWMYGCFIGVGLDGVTPKGNDQCGVALFVGANTNLIGTNGDGVDDASERNVISASARWGAQSGFYIISNSNVIAGNHIGTNASGTAALANVLAGVWIDALAANNRVGASINSAVPANERNVISGNSGFGVLITSRTGAGNSVSGNWIGVTSAGTAALPNGVGVQIEDSITGVVGGDAPGMGNVISGNTSHGIVITGTGSAGCVVQGNLVGLSVSGASALGNGGDGLVVRNGAQFCRVGTFGTGLGNDVNRRNIFSGNAGRGVRIQGGTTTGAQVFGNFIGTDRAGLASVSNGQGGIIVDDAPGVSIGGPDLQRNLVSGNSAGGAGAGIEITGAGARATLVRGNAIGVAGNGTALGNTGAGVLITGGATRTRVGGALVSDANVIAHNGAGVVVVSDASVGNSILGNAIVSNAGLGIDLGGNGVTSNGPPLIVRTGPNNLQNTPVISAVTQDGVISASLDARASSPYRVEFFSSATPDATGFGEGATFLGFVNVDTDALGRTGTFTFAISPNSMQPWITATATDLSPVNPFESTGTGITAWNTSEFSRAVRVNTKPTAAATLATGLEDTDVIITLDGSDADASDALRARVVTLPAVGSLLEFGTLTPVTAGSLLGDTQRRVVYRPPANAFGSALAAFTFLISDGTDESATATATVNVLPVADTPGVTGATTIENTMTTSGLVITRNPADGSEVTHYRITAIINGTLFESDGATPISNGAFITAAKGAAGLRFLPAPGFAGAASFNVQASLGANMAGLGGGVVQAPISVGANAKTPSVTGASTPEDVMSASGLVITRNVNNGPEVTHFKIVSLTRGQLRLADGTTPVAVGQFITAAQGAAGLRYVPVANDFGTITLSVAASLSASDAGIANPAQTAQIVVRPVNDAPSFTASNPAPVAQSSGPVVVGAWATFSPGPANESDQTVLAYLVSDVTNPALFSVQPSVNTAGALAFSPAAGMSGTSMFTVRVRDSGGTDDGGVDTSGPQTFMITVQSVNRPPDFTAADPAGVLENAGSVNVPGWVTSFTPGPADEAGQGVLEYLVGSVSNPSLLTAGPAVSRDGTLTYTVAANAFGSSTFSVRVRDNGGTDNGGNDTSQARTFRIVVRPAARCRDVTIDATRTCVSRRVSLTQISGTPSDPSPGATQTITTDRPLTLDFPLGVTPVVVRVAYSDGLTSTCTARVTVLGGDCNHNGVPDSCDIANGLSSDCNGDGVPDDCQCVWDNGHAPTAPTADGQLSHLGGAVTWGARAADDFYLQPGAMYRLFGFSGQLLTNSHPQIRKARLEFFEDCDGMPLGAPIKSYLHTAILATEPTGYGFDLVTYSFNFCNDVLLLEGGKSYWVSLMGVTDGQGTDSSYWATTSVGPNPGGAMGAPSKKAFGLPGSTINNGIWEPWQSVDDCCIGCGNFAYTLRGEACPTLWNNSKPDFGPTAGGPLSGANFQSAFPSRGADNFTVKPCADADVCLIETYVWTNCNPVLGFVEIYDNDCRKPTGAPFFSAVPTKIVPLGRSIVINGVTYPGYQFIFSNLTLRLGAGRTYWISSGANSSGSLNVRSFFAYNTDCDLTCPVRLSPAALRDQPTSPTPGEWTLDTRDLAFRIYRRADPVTQTVTGSGSGSGIPQCRSDTNHDGAVTIQDIFDFLTSWFTGCP